MVCNVNIQLKVIVSALLMTSLFFLVERYRFDQGFSNKPTIRQCGLYGGSREVEFGGLKKYTKTYLNVNFSDGVKKDFQMFSGYYRYPIQDKVIKLYKSSVGTPVCLSFTSHYTIDGSAVITEILIDDY